MKYSFLILFCVALLIGGTTITSCQDNPTRSNQTKQYFPNKVGDRWTYAVADSSGQIVDTLQVTVQQQSTLTDGTPANLWQYESRDSSYSRYVTQQADSVFFYRDSTARHITEKIVVPFKVSAWWNSPTNGYTISNIDTLKLTNGIKIRSYQIEIGVPITPSVPVNIIEKELCVSPFIGIVKHTKYSTKHFLVIESQYQLLNYTLK